MSTAAAAAARIRRSREAHRRKRKEPPPPPAVEWLVDNTTRHLGEVQHIVFVEVPGGESSSVLNMMIRFAVSRTLYLMLPPEGNMTKNKTSEKGFLPLIHNTPSPHILYDMLVNRDTFSEAKIQPHIHSDARFVMVLSDPFIQMQSASSLHRTKYLDPGPHDTAVLWGNTSNHMAVDLGFPPDQVKNASLVQDFFRNLEAVFDQVIITERLTESLVLLRRRFHWTTKDIMFLDISQNGSKAKAADIDPDVLRHFRERNQVDFTLYNHFLGRFNNSVKQEGADFQKEVSAVTDLLQQVRSFCLKDQQTWYSITVPAGPYNERFNFWDDECNTVQGSPWNLTELARKRQLWEHKQRIAA